MTQLERELKLELELQRELFNQELKSVTASYEKNLDNVSSQYQKIIEDQQNIIKQQSQTLTQYEQISTDLRVSLDQEQLQSLKQLNERLDALEQSDKDLVEQLNKLLKKL